MHIFGIFMELSLEWWKNQRNMTKNVEMKTVFVHCTLSNTSSYTVSRASCIWQNENGSYEAGPNSKCWWSLISKMGLFPICWTDDGKGLAWSAAGEILLQLILYVLVRAQPPPPQHKTDICAYREIRPQVTRLLSCTSDHWTTPALMYIVNERD
jgi:hypothetical protein